MQKQETSMTRRKTAVIQRTAEEVNNHVEYLKSRKIPFKVHSSQYSTTIDSNGVKVRYVTQVYDDKVFMCSRMIIANLKKRNIDWILKGHFSTNNYNVKPGLKPGTYGRVINIDISGAYPNCLINNNLIDQKTYKFLMDLDKKSRLPSIGMIAKKSLIYSYVEGECINVTEDNGEFQKVFHFIVYTINELMIKLREIAGDYYLMHWVDGIFLRCNTPREIQKQLIDVLKSNNYNYKFEKISHFKIEREDQMIRVYMVKNGVVKDFKFSDENMLTLYNKIAAKLNDDALNLYADPIRDLQLSPGIQDDDFADWFA